MRRRILLLVVGLTTLVVLAFAIPLAVVIRQNTYQGALSGLERQARDVLFYVSGHPTKSALTEYLDNLADRYRAQVALTADQVVGRSIPGDGENADPDDQRPDRPGPQPITTRAWHGGRLVVQQTGPQPEDPVVRVWESDDDLHSGETKWFVLLAGVALALLVLGLVAGELLTRRIVRPLLDTARTAQQLSGGDTSARAPTDGPGEVADVGRALNRLADRIDELIAEERETVADLSHRMRTPLTALRLDAEALGNPAEAERMGGHAATLERTLTAVIHAARRPQREGRLPACDATAVVGERIAFWSALTEEQERAGTISLPSAALPVRTSAEDLAAAVDALLENVVAHTPEGTAFAVRLTPRDGGGAVLVVADEGPGIPLAEPVRGRSDRGSTGLGLSIARRCAESSGGAMTISAGPSGGAVVTLELGQP
jgi:signal transduction histidine kinase